MTSPREYAQRVADTLVDVIEDARWKARIGSIRELATRADMTHTALNARMKKKTPFTVRDLAAVAIVLKSTPAALLTEAKDRVDAVLADELAQARAAAEARRAAEAPMRKALGFIDFSNDDLDDDEGFPDEIAAAEPGGSIEAEQEAPDEA